MRSLCVFLLLVAVLVVLNPCEASTRSHNGRCACPKIYMPVCGTDLKTYSNRCLLKCYADSSRGRALNVRMLRAGTCEEKNSIDIPEEQPEPSV